MNQKHRLKSKKRPSQNKFQNIFIEKENKNTDQFEYSLKRLKDVSEENFRAYLQRKNN